MGSLAKRVIIVTKKGGTFYTRQMAKRNSASGEQGETEGLLRHLATEWSDRARIIFFGRYVGEEIPGVEVVQSHIDKLSETSPGSYQEECWDRDKSNVVAQIMGKGDGCTPDDILGLVEVAGLSPTMSTIDNPNGAIVQASGVRYSGPVLGLVQRMKIPRLVINNDPRTYPKDQEMTKVSSRLIPRALLDQWDNEKTTVIGGAKYLRRSVYASCESWGYIPRYEPVPTYKMVPCTVLAHAHVETGCRVKTRAAAWKRLLAGDELKNFGIVVRGEGWNTGWRDWTSEGVTFGEKVNPSEVGRIFAESMCCPIVAMDRGFYTGKPYVCWANKCFPLFYGRDQDDPHTWDPYERLVPLYHWSRVETAEQLASVVDTLCKDDKYRAELTELYDDVLRPKFGVLDAMLNELEQASRRAGLEGVWEAVTEPEWFQRYGGLRPVQDYVS